MKRETLELVLFTLARLRDEKKRGREFAQTQITPPLPVPHLDEYIGQLEAAIADIEDCYNVKVQKVAA